MAEIAEIFSVIGFAFLLLARQSLYKYNSVLARSSFPFLFRFFRYKINYSNLWAELFTLFTFLSMYKKRHAYHYEWRNK